MRAIAVVVMLVPIAFGMPSPTVFIPPAMTVFPAPFSRSNQLSALSVCLRAVPPVFLSRPVQFVIDSNSSPLAVVVGTGLWRPKQQE
jgi:hypothetical protein